MWAPLHFTLCVLLYTSLAAAQHFRSDYKYYDEVNGWVKLHIVPASWQDARLRCKMEGATLMSPLNEDMLSTMTSLIDNETELVFTGIHATFSKGDYFSVEGIPLSDIPAEWDSGEPNDSDEQSSSCLYLTNNGTIGDIPCSYTLRYVCHKSYDNLTVNECGTTDDEYQLSHVTNSCYKFHREPRTWSRAFMTCAAEGGYLAIINSQKEAEVLSKLFHSIPTSTIKIIKNQILAFIGFHDWGEHGSWWTIHGETLKEAGYDSWGTAYGEPNNVTEASTNWQGEYCGSIYRDGRLNDLWCDYSISFICEKDPLSLTGIQYFE